MTPPGEYLTVPQVADRLHISVASAWRLINSGQLRHTVVSHRSDAKRRSFIRVKQAWLDEYMDAKAIGGGSVDSRVARLLEGV